MNNNEFFSITGFVFSILFTAIFLQSVGAHIDPKVNLPVSNCFVIGGIATGFIGMFYHYARKPFKP